MVIKIVKMIIMEYKIVIMMDIFTSTVLKSNLHILYTVDYYGHYPVLAAVRPCPIWSQSVGVLH